MTPRRKIGLSSGGFVLALAAVFVVPAVFGVDFSALATFGGFLVAGAALAARDLIADALAGVLLQIDSPFKVGDMIEVRGVVGRVAERGWRTTILDLDEGGVVAVPNRRLLSDPVIVGND